MSPDIWAGVALAGLIVVGLVIARLMLRRKRVMKTEAYWREQEKRYLIRRWKNQTHKEETPCKR